jgi:hypothetical protein
MLALRAGRMIRPEVEAAAAKGTAENVGGQGFYPSRHVLSSPFGPVAGRARITAEYRQLRHRQLRLLALGA